MDGRLTFTRRGIEPALIALAVVLTYANGLSGPFILDDQASIVQNAGIRDLGQLDRVLLPEAESPVAGRPLASLSFALNYAAGGLDVRGYHVVNVALHLGCALLLLAVARRTLDAPAPAFAIALLWAVHPLNSEVVNYVTQRTESLMALCYLATLYAAIRAAAPSRHRARWQRAAVVACALGMTAKEPMATAPLMVALYDRVFLFGSWREALRARGRLYGAFAATWAIPALLIAGSPRAASAGLSSGVSPWTYLLNQAVVITDYLRLSVWPRDLVAYYGWPETLTLADVAPYAVLVIALLIVTIVALIRWPRLGFLGAWFFVILAPSSSIIPIATEVGAERRMYLPLAALVALAVIGTRAAWRRLAPSSRGPRSGGPPQPSVATWAVPLAVVATLLAATTIARTREYASAVTLARTIHERKPTAVSAHMLGEQLGLAGRDAEAIPYLRAAIAGGNSRASYQLGTTLMNTGQADEAIQRLDAFARTYGVRQVPRWLEPSAPEVVAARLLIGQAQIRRNDWRAAAQQADWILERFPRHVEAHRLRADASFGRQQWPDARAAYAVYLQARPADASAWINYGVSTVEDDLDEAIAAFERAVQLEPANPTARRLWQLALADRANAASPATR